MKFESFYPNHSLLKNLIEYYYFQETNSDNFSTEYYSFPNIFLALNIHKKVTCKINRHHVKVNGGQGNGYLMILNAVFELPLHVQQKGKIDKVTIVFKPLGLNHFIKAPFNEVVQNTTQIFAQWAKERNTEKFFNQFFSEKDNCKRIIILENYLLSLYKPFNEYSFLNDIVNRLTDFSKEVSIEDIAKDFSISSRTLNRIFKKHIGISPVQFKKIARFRHSLTNRLFKSEFNTLTKIAYESNFYDQSYFIKIYKNLTEQNPKKFFNSIEKLADDKLIFKFILK
jgi:AraC-like DNA-binding protein